MCDGLRVPIGKNNIALMLKYVDDILLVDETEILNAFYLLISRFCLHLDSKLLWKQHRLPP